MANAVSRSLHKRASVEINKQLNIIRATKGAYVETVWNFRSFKTSDENQNKFILITSRFV
jgi:hypothetical protein